MENTIIGIIGGAVGLAGLILFVRALLFALGSSETVGRVLSSRCDEKGRYIHKVEYEAGGEIKVSEDCTGYSRALENGSSLLIVYKKSAPENFRSKQELRLNLIGFGLLALMGGAFVVRFIIF